jgi:hypothetical protein
MYFQKVKKSALGLLGRSEYDREVA